MNTTRLCALAALGACGLIALAAAPARAQDGAALMKEVRAAYAGLTSYSQKISATTTTRVGARSAVAGQTAELRYQKPNRFFVLASAPAGLVAAATDGRQEIIYLGRANVYRKLPAPATPRAFAQSIAAAGIGALLDPFAFILGEDPAAVATGFAVKGSATVNGALCRIVTAQIKPGAIRTARSARVTLWVDARTNLLRKTEIAVEGEARQVQPRGAKGAKGANGAKAAGTTVPVHVSIVEIVQEMSVNPPLNEASFTYSPPKGAVEQHPGELRGR